MAGITLERVYGALKRGRIEPVYYLTGPEDILKDELIEALIDATVEPSSRDFNVDVRTAGDLDGEAVHTLIETPPMLADRRVVVIRGLEQWRKNAKVWKVLRQYLEHPSPSTVLVLTHSGEQQPDRDLVAHTTHVTLKELKPELVRRWVTTRAADRGLTIEPEAVDHLATAVGGKLALLARELDKLAAAATGGSVTVADVAALVGIRHGETAHDWVDAVLQRDVARASQLVDIVLLYSGDTAVQLVMLLGTSLIGTRAARALLDDGTGPARVEGAVFQSIKTARPAKLRKWGVEAARWAAAAHRWSGTELDMFIAETYEADRQLKTTSITNAAGVLKALMLRAAPRIAA